MMRPGESHTLSIRSMSELGHGVSFLEDKPVFIPRTLPGEEVIAEITEVKAKYALGKCIRILQPSKDRIQPFCPDFKICGGCQLSHAAYEAQLRFKQGFLSQNLHKIGRFSKEEIERVLMPICGAPLESQTHYRNKAEVVVKWNAGSLQTGFYAEHSHDLVPVSACSLLPREMSDLVLSASRCCEELYRKEPDKAAFLMGLRHFIVRQSSQDKSLGLIIVTSAYDHNLDDAWSEFSRHHELAYLALNIQKEKFGAAMGKETILVYGKPYLIDKIGNISVKISPSSFYQINPVQTRRMYEEIKRLASLTGKETVWDLYGGIGSIGIFLGDAAEKIIGVEIHPAAVHSANENAARNGLKNAEYFVGKAEDVMPQRIKNGERADVAIVDPPRSGCDKKLLSALCDALPPKIIYVSCDTATLSRDLHYLCHERACYHICHVQPFDLFSQTRHVECVSLLQRMSNPPERTITLDVEMEDYHRIKNEGR